MAGKKLIWALGALVWLVGGIALGLIFGAGQPAPVPPYAIEKSEDGSRLCLEAKDGSRLCVKGDTEVGLAVDEAQAQWRENKEIARAFWGVFTLAPPAFILLVLIMIWRSGGVPGGIRHLEEVNFQRPER